VLPAILQGADSDAIYSGIKKLGYNFPLKNWKVDRCVATQDI